MIRKRKLAIVVAGVLLLAGVAFGVSANNRTALKSDILDAHWKLPEAYASWYSNEQWTCDGTTVSRPVQCISVKTGTTVSESSCTDTKPESSFPLYQGDEWNPPYTCEQVLSSLHHQRTYNEFKEDVCTSYPDVCRNLDKNNNKQPLYFSNTRKYSGTDIGAVTAKKGLNVFEYSGSILGTKDAGMVLNSLSYEISNYNPDTLKIWNIKLYDGISTVDSLNQFSCTQEYQKKAKKLIITCALSQPKKTVLTVKDSRGYVALYLLFDILKSETSNNVMQLSFTGGVYNDKQTNWNDQTYPVKFKTLSEADYCIQNPDRCAITADITVSVNTDNAYVIENGGFVSVPFNWTSLAPNNSPYAYLLKDTQDNANPEGGAYASIKLGSSIGANNGSGSMYFNNTMIRSIDTGNYKIVVCDQSTDIHTPTCGASWSFKVIVSS